MSGGILWRLSRDIVAVKTVTRGPTPAYMREGAVVGSLGGLYLIDDQLSPTEEDIVCGVYHQSGMSRGLMIMTTYIYLLQNIEIKFHKYRGGQNIVLG